MDQEIAETLIRRAMAQAAIAVSRGDPPFGAVLATQDGSVLLEAANAQLTTPDPTAHAEMALIRAAARELGRPMLDGLVVACNAASCSMCGSALVKARVGTIVLGAPSESHMDPPVALEELVRRSTHRIELVGPVLADECRAQIAAARAVWPAPD